MDDELTFGQWLRRSRKASDLTQAELAGQAGCAVGTLRKLEADELRPSKELAMRLAAYFGVPETERVTFVAYARGHANTPTTLAPVVSPKGTSTAPRPVGQHEEGSPLTTRPSNLPVLRESLIGRIPELVALQQLLQRADVGLVTLTGPGGTGKTRLALQVAATLGDAFPDGVWFVDLAPIRDPALVVSAIATVLGIQDIGGAGLPERMQAYLRDKRLLLLLDNFEQVVTAAPLVANLLASVPGLKVLLTSRVVVGIYGEYDVPVPPLAVPDSQHLPPLEHLADYEAVQLFRARVQAATGSFTLTPTNARLVAELCQRLEGLPLAIELAAARLRHLPLETVVTRLGNRLQLLTGGARTLPRRQQTLRDTLAWSYELLDAGGQQLFRRLAVFVGGWTLEAAEAVCNTPCDLPCPVLDGLTTLVDQSLVRQSMGLAGDVRFTMLETIREYALEQLGVSGERETLRRHHATYYLGLGEQAEPELRRSEQALWLARLELEHNNLRAALGWSQAAAASDPVAGELGVRLAVAVWEFWSRWGYLREGRHWLEVALTQVTVNPSDREACHLRARALSAAGNLAAYQNDSAVAEVLLAESLALFRQLGDPWWSAYVLLNLGQNCVVHDPARSVSLMEESLSAFRELTDRWGIAWTLLFLAGGLLVRTSAAPTPAELDQGIPRMEEGLAHFRVIEDSAGITSALGVLGSLVARQGNLQRARALLRECLTQYSALQGKLGLPPVLVEFALLEAYGQQHMVAVRVARLLGAADALASSMGQSDGLVIPDGVRSALGMQLGETAFEAALTEGRAMTSERALAYALGEGAG